MPRATLEREIEKREPSVTEAPDENFNGQALLFLNDN